MPGRALTDLVRRPLLGSLFRPVAALWSAETALSATFGGTISRGLRAIHVQRTVDLEDHVVVCGYGTFGRTVTDRL